MPLPTAFFGPVKESEIVNAGHSKFGCDKRTSLSLDCSHQMNFGNDSGLCHDIQVVHGVVGVRPRFDNHVKSVLKTI